MTELLNPQMTPITRLWRTGKDVRVRICDMDDRHLDNTIRYVERKARERGLNQNANGHFTPYEKAHENYLYLLMEQERRWSNQFLRRKEQSDKLTERLDRGKPRRRRRPTRPSKREIKRRERLENAEVLISEKMPSRERKSNKVKEKRKDKKLIRSIEL